MSVAPAVSPQIPPYPVRRFTVEEYHQMARAGVLTEDDSVELLEGWIVPKMVRNPRHDVALKLAETAVERQLSAGWHVRVPSAITTAESEPEPDLAVVKGDVRAYLNDHPRPDDVALVIEIADSSLARDCNDKARIYAAAGIGTYWIVNLVESIVEVHSAPAGAGPSARFTRRTKVAADGTVAAQLSDGAPLKIVARDLLP